MNSILKRLAGNQVTRKAKETRQDSSCWKKWTHGGHPVANALVTSQKDLVTGNRIQSPPYGTVALIILASIQQYVVNASLRIMNQEQFLFGLGITSVSETVIMLK